MTALGLGWESVVCPEAEIVERPSPAEGTARMRAEAGKGRAGFGTKGEGSWAGAHGLCGRGSGGRIVSLERQFEASCILKTRVSTSVSVLCDLAQGPHDVHFRPFPFLP